MVMNKSEIINKLATEGKVEELISNITKSPPTDDEQDLAQDIYLSLLEKEGDLIEELYNNGQLIFFITRMLLNNIRSQTSPYYYKYKRYEANKTTIDDPNIFNPQGGEDDM